jgi:phage FluMu gp28-like protein
MEGKGGQPAVSAREEYLTELRAADERYARSCWSWLIDEVQTLDEASKAIRRWPDLPYLHDLIDVLTDPDERLIAIPKARRMMATWCVAEWVHWLTRYHPHVLAVWQSRTQTMAAEVVDKRIDWAENHLIDAPMRRTRRGNKTAEGLIGRITWDKSGSRIVAVAEGAHVFRSLTPTVLVMDEVEFQEQGPGALAAAMPFAEKGARIVLLSSSNGPGKPLAGICKSVGFSRWK